MNFVVQTGLIELAAGAAMGWLVAAERAVPELLVRLRIRHPRRILQMHLDYIIMGVILIAVGLAVPGLATWAGIVLIVGTVVNPALFLPLAFRESVADTLWYRAVSVASFTAVTVGTIAAAVQGFA